MASKEFEETVELMRSMASPGNVAGMARYGISTEGTLGVAMPELKRLAKRIGRNHELALELWESGLREGRILAALVADPSRTDRPLMERWASHFDSWDVCDQVCSYLFSRTEQAYNVIPGWAARKEEFVRRAAFVMIAALAMHDKRARDEAFRELFPIVELGASDNRNYVRKAVSWAIRQMGKRNLCLRRDCLELAERVRSQGTPSARWIASDAFRELNSSAVKARLEARERRSKERGRCRGRTG